MRPIEAVRDFLLNRNGQSIYKEDNSAESFLTAPDPPFAIGRAPANYEYDWVKILVSTSTTDGVIRLVLINFMLEVDRLLCTDIYDRQYRLEYADPKFFEQLETILAGKRL